MLSASSLVDFLLNLLGDSKAKAEFQHDPEGVLARHGLNNVCGQDVRDAQDLLADHPGVHATGTFENHSVGDDPIREISYMNRHYTIDKSVTHNQYDVNYIDDRDTTNINARGDVNIKDSFNSENHLSVVKDSNNYSNSGVDNRGGTIDHSTVAGHDVSHSGNTETSTSLDHSLDTDNSHTNLDLHDDHSVNHSLNDEHHDSHDSLHAVVEPDDHLHAHDAVLAVV